VHEAAHKAFTNDADIEKEYYPESIELIKRVTGASRVVLFDHSTSSSFRSPSCSPNRRSAAIRRNRPGEIDDSPQKRQPVPLVHVDQTAESALARVHRHLPPDDAPALARGRFQIINLWRPIGAPALDFPLALCDYSSINPKTDLVPSDLLYPDRKGETNGVKYSDSHRWKYVRGMRPEEFVLIKWSVYCSMLHATQLTLCIQL
jgi:hypothetical protein